MTVVTNTSPLNYLLNVIGTLGVLDRAAARKLVEFPNAWQRLQAANFHATPRLVAELLHRDELRRRAAKP
jgi:predicted nucleic acid-binding protein